MEGGVEYKVGQKVWFIHNDTLTSDKIKVIEEGYLRFEHDEFPLWTYCIDTDLVAPTKEALKIKIFGE